MGGDSRVLGFHPEATSEDREMKEGFSQGFELWIRGVLRPQALGCTVPLNQQLGEHILLVTTGSNGCYRWIN